MSLVMGPAILWSEAFWFKMWKLRQETIDPKLRIFLNVERFRGSKAMLVLFWKKNCEVVETFISIKLYVF